MSFFRLLSSILLLSSICLAKCEQQRVAIIDTGLDITDPRFTKLICKDGHHWDFVHNRPIEADFHGHGTHIAGLIKRYAERSDYCLLIYRYYDNSGMGYNNLYNEIKAINQAVKDGATVVNISGGGSDKSTSECEAIMKAPLTTFVVAAGNDGRDIGVNGYYPAACGSQNIVAVGSLDRSDKKLPSSNWGSPVKAWELGFMVLSTLPNGRMGTMSGTSQSTAIHTGKTILQRSHQCGTIR